MTRTGCSVKMKVWPRPRIGISSCLLGNRVRHNGEHKKNDWLYDELGNFVDWVPICPEVEMGLGVPRETLRLVGEVQRPQLQTVKSKIDYTEKARETIEKILRKDLNLNAYIFKKDSPSCGLERVKVYGSSGIPSKAGVGLFALAIKERYPHILLIEEGRLSDIKQREAFLIHLFTFTEFREIPRTMRSLQLFHQYHKLQLMAYDPKGYRDLGRLAANSNCDKIDVTFERYQILLAELFRKPLTRKKYVNVFQHMLGYFKTQLEGKEKAHLLRLLEDYGKGKIPLISISTIFNFIVEKYSSEYLLNQNILNPYPEGILGIDSDCSD